MADKGKFTPVSIIKRSPKIKDDGDSIFDTYRTGDILPFKVNERTKKVSLAIPKGLQDLYNTIDKIYKGEIDPESPEAIQASMNAAMMVGTGGVATSGAVGGAGTMGMFIGKNAATFDKAAAEEALQMAKAGFNAKDILKQTGVRRWKSGARQEIDDSSAAFSKDYLDLPFASTKLNSMIDHPELFKAYPDLKNLRVIVRDDLPAGNAGMNFSRNEAYISKKDVDSRTISPLLHEIQHWIQNNEGWQAGANIESFKAGKHVLPYSGEVVNLTPTDKYIMSPGENEAVATEARRLLTNSERRNRLPELDFTIDYRNMYDFYN